MDAAYSPASNLTPQRATFTKAGWIAACASAAIARRQAMLIQFTRFPPVPADTARAAEAVFGKGNIYMTIGDRVDHLLANVDVAMLDGLEGKSSAATSAVLALMTAFQFAENLPDHQAAEAIRTRVEWKYALHLPLDYPGIEPAGLCEFRRRLWFDAIRQRVFQQILDSLSEMELFRERHLQGADTIEVLTGVCGLSRLESLVEAMSMVLEVLAASRPAWLLKTALPHWYERYTRARWIGSLPHQHAEQVALAEAIGGDALHLLDALTKANADLAMLPEVQALWQVWHQQFNQPLHQFRWRTPLCAACQ